MDPNQLPIQENDPDIAAAMRGVPSQVRDFLTAGKCAVFAEAFMSRYDLHIDQAATLEKELALLLLGIESPSSFVAVLSGEMKLPREIVERMVVDVGREIFTPIQEEMRNAAQKPIVPQPKPVPPAPQYVAARSMPQQAAPQPTVMQAPPTVSAPPNLPGVPRPERMLEDHEEPHINVPGKQPEMYVRRPQPRPYVPPTPPVMPRPVQPPVVQAPPPSVPRPTPPLPPRPQMPTMQPHPQMPLPPQQSYMRPNPPAPRPPVVPQNIPQPPRPPEPNRPVLKEYGVDPYREAPE